MIEDKKYLNPMSKEFQDECKRLGSTGHQLMQKYKEKRWYKEFKQKYGKEFADWAKQNKDNVPSWIVNAGCKNNTEYQDYNAKKRGYVNISDYVKQWKYENGISSPMEDNENCSSNFGICKGEKLFKKFLEDVIFNYVKGSNKVSCDGGIDFICKNPRQDFINKYPQFKLKENEDYIIQLRMRCVTNGYLIFHHIDFDNIADYFILCGWDKRDGKPICMLIFHRDDMVRHDPFWMRRSISICPWRIEEFEGHELIDELKIWKKITDESK